MVPCVVFLVIGVSAAEMILVTTSTTFCRFEMNRDRLSKVIRRAYLGTAVTMAVEIAVKVGRYFACFILSILQSMTMFWTIVILWKIMSPMTLPSFVGELSIVVLLCAVFVVNVRLYARFKIDDVLIEQYVRLRRVHKALRCYGALQYLFWAIWIVAMAFLYVKLSQ